MCLYHSEMLSPGMWTDDLVTPGSVKNPRLVYDLFSNFLLIQQYYNCNQENYPNHRFFVIRCENIDPASREYIGQVPISEIPPLFIFLSVDYVFDQISRGVNFL